MSASRGSPVLLALCAACAGVSVRPDRVDAATLPTIDVSAADAQERDAQIESAIDAVVRRRYGEAEAAARAALALDPRAARARAVLGMVTFQKAGLDDPPDLFLLHEGEAELELARQLAPDDAFVGWMHAVLLAEGGHLSAAAETAEGALRRAIGAPAAERAALLGIAGTYRYELGEERAAVPHLQAYVALRPDDATAQFRLGASLLRIAALPSGPRPNSLVAAQAQADGAARAFARCAELVPGDDDVALAAGAALVRAAELAGERGDLPAREQRWHDAEVRFRAVAERFPTSAEAVFRLGVVAELRGDEAAARVAYTDALQRDPAHLGSLLNLARSHERTGARDGESAVRELLQRALRVGTELGTLSDEERAAITARLAAGAEP